MYDIKMTGKLPLIPCQLDSSDPKVADLVSIMSSSIP